MDRNERRDRIRGQMRTLTHFFKELQTWDVSYIGSWLVTGTLVPVSSVMFFVPYQKMSADELHLYLIMSYLLVIGLFMYLRPYLLIIENRKTKRVAEKLQYLPVSRAGYLLFVLKKLSRLLLLAGGVQLVGQCAAAYLCYSHIGAGNILWPVMAGVVLPGGVNALAAVSSCYFRFYR